MEDPREALVGRVDRLARRVAVLGAMVVIMGITSLGLGVWIMFLTNDLSRAWKQENRLRASVDSLRAGHTGVARHLEGDSKRLAIVERRVNGMWGGVRRAEVIALRNWISRLESRTEKNRSRIEELNRGLDHGPDGGRDSLSVTRSRIENAALAS